MARIRTYLCYADTKGELVEYKDAKRGALEDAFWDEDELVDHRPKRNKKNKKRPGCPGNDNGPHLYVWVPWYWDSKYEVKVCCGCEKRARRAFRRKP